MGPDRKNTNPVHATPTSDQETAAKPGATLDNAEQLGLEERPQAVQMMGHSQHEADDHRRLIQVRSIGERSWSVLDKAATHKMLPGWVSCIWVNCI